MRVFFGPAQEKRACVSSDMMIKKTSAPLSAPRHPSTLLLREPRHQKAFLPEAAGSRIVHAAINGRKGNKTRGIWDSCLCSAAGTQEDTKNFAWMLLLLGKIRILCGAGRRTFSTPRKQRARALAPLDQSGPSSLLTDGPSVCVPPILPPGRVGSLFSLFPGLLLIFSHIYSAVVLKKNEL